jgi:hypothetical protein
MQQNPMARLLQTIVRDVETKRNQTVLVRKPGSDQDKKHSGFIDPSL